MAKPQHATELDSRGHLWSVRTFLRVVLLTVLCLSFLLGLGNDNDDPHPKGVWEIPVAKSPKSLAHSGNSNRQKVTGEDINIP